MMNKNTIVTVLIVIVVVVGAIFLMQGPNTDKESLVLGIVSETDWKKGAESPKITLVEYSDFQCPACRAYSLMIKDLLLEYNNEVQFVYRHFPLRQIHANAEPAARAVEAAGLQGKFWEMHDILFERQLEWGNQPGAITLITGYASELGLDVDQFEADLVSDLLKNKVKNDLQEAFSAGFNSTPTFVLNGKIISNPRSLEQFRELISQELAQTEE